MFEFRQLRSFIMVATELHFGRAAVRLNMTQPPLSRQMQQLEEDVGVQLFSRTSRVVQLTPAGKAFLVEAKKLIQQSESARDAALRAADLHRGAVRVGMIGATTYEFLPKLLLKARSELPNIDLNFRELTSPEQLEELSMNRIDIGFVRLFSDTGDFQSTCVMREKMALALPLDHPLASRRRPQLSQLDGEDFIMYAPDARYFHNLLSDAFRREGIRPIFVQQMSQAQAILAMVSTGLGIAIVPEGTQNACFDNVVFRPIDLGENITADLHAIWRSDNNNPALLPLRELVTRMA